MKFTYAPRKLPPPCLDEPKTTPGGGATAKAGPRGGATADKAGPRGGATADKDGPRGEEQPAAMSDEEVHGEEEEVKRKEGVKTKKQKKENKAAASPKAASPKAASPKGSKKKSEPGVQEDQPTEDKTALREDGSDEGEEGWSTVRKRVSGWGAALEWLVIFWGERMGEYECGPNAMPLFFTYTKFKNRYLEPVYCALQSNLSSYEVCTHKE